MVAGPVKDPEEMNPAVARARGAVRHLALDLLSARQRRGGRIDAALARPRVHLPYLHAVPAREEDRLRELLAALAPTHAFISYSEAVDRIRRGDIDRPYVAFSFDDAFASNTRTARVLEEFGAPSMFFVPPGFIGTRSVAEAREFYGFSEGVDEPAMTWGDLEDLLARGHEVGNHTLGHKVMSWVDQDQVLEEVSLGAADLRSRLGEVTHFAWPRGRFHHFTDAAARTVFETGHTSCASAERGAHVHGSGPSVTSLCLRRDHLMTRWPLRHLRYLLARSAAGADGSSNTWPEEWDVA